MSGAATRRALRRSLDQIRYVSAVRPAAADGIVAAVYRQAEHDFGMLAPPLALHSPAPGPLAACWLMLRETLLAPGLAGRADKEAVAAAVSLGNACPYCTTVHSTAMHAVVRGASAAAIASDRIAEVADPRIRDIAAWARVSGLRDQVAARDAPFPAEQAPELAGVAVTFQYLNRMVNVYLGESPLPAAVPAAAGRVLMNVLGRVMLSARPAATAPGLLPAAELPGELSWAAGSPRVAAAFASAAAAIERAGADAVPPRVRELTLGELAGWDGRPRGPSRAWADAAASALPEPDRAAGRLALLTAFASYQVVASDIGDFRRGQPQDAALIALTSWASFAAARRVGSWLASPRGQELAS